MKKGPFSVERVSKGIFWGETYFLDFSSITHTLKLFPCTECFSFLQHVLFLKLKSYSLIKSGYWAPLRHIQGSRRVIMVKQGDFKPKKIIYKGKLANITL